MIVDIASLRKLADIHSKNGSALKTFSLKGDKTPKRFISQALKEAETELDRNTEIEEKENLSVLCDHLSMLNNS